jgi:hypothetical protein
MDHRDNLRGRALARPSPARNTMAPVTTAAPPAATSTVEIVAADRVSRMSCWPLE